MGRPKAGHALLALALAVAAALYAPTLSRGLVNFEDPWLVRDNYVVQRASLASVRIIFFDLDSPARFALAPEYLPVRDLSMMADFAIWGDWYPGFHITNLVLYLAAIALWFAALTAFGIDRTIVGVAMLLWAVHPVHAESVAWISERKGLLGAVFAGATVFAYARWRVGGRIGRRVGWIALATLTAVLAVWSKAQAAFGVAAIAGLELALPDLRASWRRSLTGLGALAIAGAAAFVPVLMLATHSAVVGLGTIAGGHRVTTVLGVLGFYARLAAMIVPNAIAYAISARGPSAIEVGLGAIFLGALLAVVAVPKRGWWAPPPVLRAAAAIWLITWLPISHMILSLEMVMVADRYLLLPTLGVALAAAVGLMRIPRPRARAALIAAIAIAAAMRAFDAQSSWASPLALWDRAVESAPDDADAWSFYAEALGDRGQLDDARAATEHGLAFAPTNPRLLLRLALLQLDAGQRTAALVSFRLAADAGEPRAMTNLALLELEDHNLPDALVWAERGANAAPQLAHGQQIWGKVALAAHHDADALAAFTRASVIEPDRLVHRYNLALALLALHRPADAIPHLEAAAHDPALAQTAAAALTEAHRQLAPH